MTNLSPRFSDFQSRAPHYIIISNPSQTQLLVGAQAISEPQSTCLRTPRGPYTSAGPSPRSPLATESESQGARPGDLHFISILDDYNMH